MNIINDIKHAYRTATVVEKIRQKGSHIAMQKKSQEGTVTVIVPDHKEVKIGTLMSIIRQSKISRNAFE